MSRLRGGRDADPGGAHRQAGGGNRDRVQCQFDDLSQIDDQPRHLDQQQDHIVQQILARVGALQQPLDSSLRERCPRQYRIERRQHGDDFVGQSGGASAQPQQQHRSEHRIDDHTNRQVQQYRRDGLGGRSRCRRLRRDTVHRQQRRSFRSAQELATFRQRSLKNPARGAGVGVEPIRPIRRRLQQRDPVPLLTPALHESPDRVVRRVVGGNARRQQAPPNSAGIVDIQVAGQHAQSLATARTIPFDGFDRGGGTIGGRNQRVWRVQHQHTVGFRRFQQDVQDGGEPGTARVTTQIERVVGRGARHDRA